MWTLFSAEELKDTVIYSFRRNQESAPRLCYSSLIVPPLFLHPCSFPGYQLFESTLWKSESSPRLNEAYFSKQETEGVVVWVGGWQEGSKERICTWEGPTASYSVSPPSCDNQKCQTLLNIPYAKSSSLL